MNLEIFKNNGLEIRGGLDNSKPYFIAKDVCNALGMKNHREALRHLDADEKGVILNDTLGGTQNISVVNESGLYALILRSRKAEAKVFTKWVTSEVLPSIRQHGNYIDNELKNHMETFLPKDGFLKENKNGELKTKAVRGYYRVDKNSEYGKLLTRRHQLQKRLNGFFIEEIKLELAEIETEIFNLEEDVA